MVVARDLRQRQHSKNNHGHWIVARTAPWVTTEYAFHCQPSATEGAVFTYSLLSILGTSRCKAACRRGKRRDTSAVKGYQRQHQFGKQPPQGCIRQPYYFKYFHFIPMSPGFLPVFGQYPSPAPKASCPSCDQAGRMQISHCGHTPSRKQCQCHAPSEKHTTILFSDDSTREQGDAPDCDPRHGGTCALVPQSSPGNHLHATGLAPPPSIAH